MKNIKNIFLIVILLILLFTTSIYAKVSYLPNQNFYVNDFANILSSSTKEKVLDIANKTEQDTTAQIVVVTVPNLEGRDIESYANELFNTWKIGSKEKDNGVLLLISSGDRKVRIEVGYGLEGAINDAKAGRILDDVAISYMKNNDYDTAVVNVVNELQGIIYNEYGIEGGFDNYDIKEQEERYVTLIAMAVFVIIIFIRIFLASKGIYIFGGFGGRGRGGFGGGSFGGGHFGGGGSSGGGGASRGF